MTATGFSGPLGGSDPIGKLKGALDPTLERLSGVTACLLPILKEMDWQGDMREIAEALPHFVDEIDLTHLRNTLLNLGYETHPAKTVLGRMDKRLVPCIFVEAETEETTVILSMTGKLAKVWRNGNLDTVDLRTAQLDGTAYYITKSGQENPLEAPHIMGWFGQVLGRFQRSAKMLFMITLVTNVIAILFPVFIMFIYDRVIRMQSSETLPFLLIGVLIFLGVDLALRYLRAKTIGYVAGRIDYVLGVKTFDRIFNLSPVYTERAAVSTQLARIKEFESIRDFFTGPLVNAAVELPFILLTVTAIGILAGPLAFVPLITLLGYVLVGMFMLPRSRQLKQESGHASSSRDDLLVETLLSNRTIKETSSEDLWEERYRLSSADACYTKQKFENHNAVMDAVSQALVMLSGVVVLAWGTHLVILQQLSVGALIATMILVWKALTPIQTGFLAYAKLDQIKRSLLQLNNLMALRPEGNLGKARLLLETPDGDIAFKNVSFRYGPDTDPALLQASFNVKKGHLVSFVGPNSSGKSTILKLLLGLYQAQGGALTIDGLDTRQIDPRDLRRKIGYAPQDVQFFYGTIEQNLRLSDPTVSDQRLREAVRQVGLLEVVEALPEGFQTRIGLGTSEDLAPGFLQRLNIARALVRDAPILLLDEPGQGLDDAGDQALVETLENLKGSRTILMVSHRPSHIRLSDHAVLLNRGMVEFEGNPEDALKLIFGRAKQANQAA